MSFFGGMITVKMTLKSMVGKYRFYDLDYHQKALNEALGKNQLTEKVHEETEHQRIKI